MNREKHPIKAQPRKFTKQQFYLIQTNSTEKRFVISITDKLTLRILMAGFINEVKNYIQIKIIDLNNTEKPKVYYGTSDKSKLHKLMTKYEDVIFHNGFHELLLRNPDNGHHIALDEHGLLFVYSNKDYAKILSQLKIEFKPKEKLIYEKEHWHFCLSDGYERLSMMINDLELKIQE